MISPNLLLLQSSLSQQMAISSLLLLRLKFSSHPSLPSLPPRQPPHPTPFLSLPTSNLSVNLTDADFSSILNLTTPHVPAAASWLHPTVSCLLYCSSPIFDYSCLGPRSGSFHLFFTHSRQCDLKIESQIESFFC